MTDKDLNQYNIVLCDFDWFLEKIEIELMDILYEAKLLEDKTFKNIDTKKTILYVVMKKLIEKIHSHKEKCVFIVKPEIVHKESELLTHYNPIKLRRLLMTLFKFMKKNKFDVFIFMRKSYTVQANQDLLDDDEIRDFIDLHVEKTSKKLALKSTTIHRLFNKLSKQL